MKLLKRILKSEAGQALPIALILLVLGVSLVVPTLSLTTTNLKASQVVDNANLELYAADAGVEDMLWNIKDNDSFHLPDNGQLPVTLPSFNLNDKEVNVTVSKQTGQPYLITSIATSPSGHNTTIECYLDILTTGGGGVFDYALTALNGNITLTGSSEVGSSPTLHDGDVYANGNITLTGSAQIDGDANATGTISGESHITGNTTELADPVSPPAAAMNTLIDSSKAEAQDATCTSCVAYTYTGSTWAPTASTYSGANHAKNNMSISGSGTWIFNDAVCVGVDTNSNLTISGSSNVTFKGPVKVGGTLNINTSGTVTFGDSVDDTVCVGHNISISGSGTVIFTGPVYVGYNPSFTSGRNFVASGSGYLQLLNTLYVTDTLQISGSHPVQLGGAVYVSGNIDMSGSNGVTGGQNVIAEGNITISGSNQQLPADQIPFVISTSGNVTMSGSNWTSALIYAPEGQISMSGSNKLYGCAVGESVNVSGSVDIMYPSDLRDREDLPGNGSSTAGLQIRTYTIE